METIIGTMIINDVIKKYPQTIRIFNDYKVDSCCGGGAPIETTANVYYRVERNRAIDQNIGLFDIDRRGVSMQQERELGNSYVWSRSAVFASQIWKVVLSSSARVARSLPSGLQNTPY